MLPEELYIVNHWDRPCVKLLARKTDEGLLEYLQKENLRNYNLFPITEDTFSLKDFGFVLIQDRYIWLNESKAKYSDGKTRIWQDIPEFTL